MIAPKVKKSPPCSLIPLLLLPAHLPLLLRPPLLHFLRASQVKYSITFYRAKATLDGSTALHVAAECGNLQALLLLMNRWPIQQYPQYYCSRLHARHAIPFTSHVMFRLPVALTQTNPAISRTRPLCTWLRRYSPTASVPLRAPAAECARALLAAGAYGDAVDSFGNPAVTATEDQYNVIRSGHNCLLACRIKTEQQC